MGQATCTQHQRLGGQPGDRTAERRADADSHAHFIPQADAAPPDTEPIGDGVPARDRYAAPDRYATADRHADIRVPDRHPVARRHGEHAGNRLTAPAR
jgi:hypothetical protein